MEYEGMSVEDVARGINGATASATGAGAAAGAGAAFFFLVAFFFFLDIKPAAAARPRHATNPRNNHCQICKLKPEEPDAAESELAAELEESLAIEPLLKEPRPKPFKLPLLVPEDPEKSLCNDAEEVPEPEEADESHGVAVVGATVVAAAFALITGAKAGAGASVGRLAVICTRSTTCVMRACISATFFLPALSLNDCRAAALVTWPVMPVMRVLRHALCNCPTWTVYVDARIALGVFVHATWPSQASAISADAADLIRSTAFVAYPPQSF